MAGWDREVEARTTIRSVTGGLARSPSPLFGCLQRRQDRWVVGQAVEVVPIGGASGTTPSDTSLRALSVGVMVFPGD